MYILDGTKADLANVVREQRIRIERGLVSLTPIGDAGLVSREDFDEKCSKYDEKCTENDLLRNEITEKCNEIEDLRKEVEFYKNQIPTMPADSKDVPVTDEKTAPAADSKEAPVPDEKTEVVEDSKKSKKK